jgi:hypothetical protein
MHNKIPLVSVTRTQALCRRVCSCAEASVEKDGDVLAFGERQPWPRRGHGHQGSEV